MNEGAGRWGLRLLALVGAVVVWWLASVDQRERISERLLDASLSYNSPAGMVLLDPQSTVKVRLRGPDSLVRRIAPTELAVVVDVEPGEPGVRSILLGPSSVAAPDGIEVRTVEPNALTIRVDREATVELPIVVRLVGEPAGGAVPGVVRTLPDRARVAGPQGIVASLVSISTAPVSLDGHALSFSQTVSLVSTDPLVRVVAPPFVSVQVAMSQPDPQQPPARDGDERR